MEYLNKKAEMGVGTLIIFIAMLLVAAVAAGVLIQTVGSLQSKALSVGSQSEYQISTNAVAIEVSAIDGTDSTVEDFQYITKLAPGSDPMKLEQVTLSLSTLNSSTSYIYDQAPCSRDTDFTDATVDGYFYNASTENGTFSVAYLQKSTTWVNGTMQRGDVVKICFGSPYSIAGDQQVRINFIPKVGTATLTEFVVPDVISTYRLYLFP